MAATVGSEPTILVIDDSAAARMFVRVTLELEGFRVLEAAAGDEGLQVLRTHPEVSVVVLDLVLPDRGGLDVADDIRTMVGRSVGVVAFTGTVLSDGGELHPALDAVVLKPSRPERLAGAVLAHAPDTGRETRGMVDVHAPPSLPITQSLRSRLHNAGFRPTVASAEVRSSPVRPVAAVVWVGRTGEGFVTAARLRMSEHGTAVPVVLASAEPLMDDDRDLASRAGASTIVTVDAVADAVEAAGTRPPPPVPTAPPTAHDRLAYLERRLSGSTEVGDAVPSRDALTGLPRRDYLAFSAYRLVEEAGSRNAAMGALLIGLDRLARVNDALGRDVADVVLGQVGSRLSQFEPYHAVGRIEADRFGLLTTRAESDAALMELAHTVLAELDRPYLVHGLELYVTASIGITRVAEASRAAMTEAMAEAEMALRRAKDQGGGQAVIFRDQWKVEARRVFALEQDLRDALGHPLGGGLVLDYQPRVDLVTGAISGGEALLRWNHPARGWLAPDEFIPIAERSGLIVDLGAWVLAAGARQATAWRAAGLDVAVAVNVGAGQLHADSFLPALQRVIHDNDLPPGALELEITETTAMADLEHAATTLRTAKTHGVRIALDDFGTGYSSLAYLRHLPVDVVKLDRAFVVDLPSDTAARDTVEAVLTLGNKQRFLVVGEGVETRQELAALVDIGCSAAQGFLFSGAVQPAAFEQLARADAPYRDLLTPEQRRPTPPA